MGENTTKKKGAKRNKWNVAVVKQLAKGYKFSEYYIREILRGDKNPLESELIKNDYARLCKVQEDAFEGAMKNVPIRNKQSAI